jgi:VRR-NUC domain
VTPLGKLQFERSPERWWQKPLVVVADRHLPAELVVLQASLRAGENGAWLNSRGIGSATVDLKRDELRKFKTVRVVLPDFVAGKLRDLYKETQLKKGAPDLVVWHERTRRIRFVEVKNPLWDRPSHEQLKFLRAAQAKGMPTEIAEWGFRP